MIRRLGNAFAWGILVGIALERVREANEEIRAWEASLQAGAALLRAWASTAAEP